MSVANCLPLSLAKCLCLHLGHGNICYSYTLGGVLLPAVEQCTDLGVIRSSDFSYAAHIHSIVNKASRAVGVITRVFSTRNELVLKKLFVAYARLIMEYASAVWNPLSVGLDNNVEKVQSRFTKKLYSLHLTPYKARLAHLNLPILRSRRNGADLVTVVKALHGSLGVEASDLGLIASDSQKIRSCGTDLKVHRAVTNNVAKTVNFRISKVWNKLPVAAKTASSLPVFKNVISKL